MEWKLLYYNRVYIGAILGRYWENGNKMETTRIVGIIEGKYRLGCEIYLTNPYQTHSASWGPWRSLGDLGIT